MFGLITPNFTTLTKEEKSRYQSIYCGLCHSLRDNYNNVSRFALTFDLTFLVFLLSSLYEPIEKISHCNCIFHPGFKYNAIQNIVSAYCADLTIILAYHKLNDDIVDENKIKAKIAVNALHNQYLKVEAKYPDLCSYTFNAMHEITMLEKDQLKVINKIINNKKFSEDVYNFNDDKSYNVNSILEDSFFLTGDKISKIFGSIMAMMFSYKKDTWSHTLAKLGADLGRFIYFMDAAIDLKKDRINKSYNPYFFSGEPEKESLMVLAGYATESFEKLPLEQDYHLLQNILYEGMWINYNHCMEKQNKHLKSDKIK